MSRCAATAAMGLLVLLTVTAASSQTTGFRSPDGKFEARRHGAGADEHYQIVEPSSNKVFMTTQAAYSTPNDVKTGVFSRDSRYVAAVYHYGHKGPETWIGVWEVRSGKRVRCEWRHDWVRMISADEARPGECPKR